MNYFLLHCTLIFLLAPSVSQIFKILSQSGDIKIFVIHGVFFSIRYQGCSEIPSNQAFELKGSSSY